MVLRRAKSAEKKDRTPLPEHFNEARYLARNDDVRAAVAAGAFRSGADHYQQHGGREGRDPNPAVEELGHTADVPAWNDVGRDGLPLPPPDLMFLVTNGRDPEAFQNCGEADLRLVRNAVAEAGIRLPERGMKVLDWGCGCGRLARFWSSEAAQVEVFGCDINPELVAWCRDNLPFGQFAVSEFDPPLAYAEGSFDLLYGISVFTHLTFNEHYHWMREIHRLLTPNGAAVLTGHGPTMLSSILVGARAAYENGAVRTDLIDQESFICLEHAAGSNATGNVLSRNMFAHIFRPFDVRLHRACYGLMGIHDTYVVTKKTSRDLVWLEDASTPPLTGNSATCSIPVELDGHTGFAALVHADNLFYGTHARCMLKSVETDELLVEPITITLPDKIKWTSLNQAYALIAFDGIREFRGRAQLDLEIEGFHLDGSVLHLTKMMLY